MQKQVILQQEGAVLGQFREKELVAAKMMTLSLNFELSDFKLPTVTGRLCCFQCQMMLVI
jgi:hypothetical protein